MILKRSVIAQLLRAVEDLDGFRRPGAVVHGVQMMVIQEPYRFSGKATWNKTKNLKILRKKVQEIEEDRVTLVKAHCGPNDKNVPEDRMDEFQSVFKAMMEAEDEVPGLLVFSKEDLNIYDKQENPEGNVIPSSVLEALLPLIVTDDGAAAP